MDLPIIRIMLVLCNAMLFGNAFRLTVKQDARHLLQDLLVCNKCGCSYYGKPVSNAEAKGKKCNYAYYRCIGLNAYRFVGIFSVVFSNL